MHNLHHNIRSLYTTVDVDITQCQIDAKDDQFLEGKFTKSNKQISSSVAYSSLDSGSLHCTTLLWCSQLKSKSSTILHHSICHQDIVTNLLSWPLQSRQQL